MSEGMEIFKSNDTTEGIKNKIYTIRGVQVMLDSDLAEIYGYEVKALNQQVKRNINRFPGDFMFQLTREEIDSVKSQFVTSPNEANLKSQIVTSSWGTLFEGQNGGGSKIAICFYRAGNLYACHSFARATGRTAKYIYYACFS